MKMRHMTSSCALKNRRVVSAHELVICRIFIGLEAQDEKSFFRAQRSLACRAVQPVISDLSGHSRSSVERRKWLGRPPSAYETPAEVNCSTNFRAAFIIS